MKKTWLFLIIPALLLLTGSRSGFSQDKKAAGAGLEQTLYMGEIKAVDVDSPSRVVVGNPVVADVISVSAQEIMVAGKGAGATNLIWWDDFGEHHLRLRVFTEDMGEIKSRIDGLIKELNLPNVLTRTADSEGKVLLLGSVKSNEDMDRIKTALGLLFSRTTNLIKIDEEKAIIELDVEVLEVNKDGTKTLGMNWLDSTAGAIALTEPSRFATKLAGVPDSLIRVTEWTHTSLGATLNLLVQEGKARILSRPKLACQSGKEAELLVGGEKPIMTTQSGNNSSDSTSVEYKEYGIKLKMAPVLTGEGKIKLALNVEVSDVGTAEILGETASPTARAYPLTKRATATQLYLNDGQTLAISGLIKQKTEEDLQKLPWLGDIPVLGMFFRSRSTKQGGGSGERGDTELVIMITPIVIKDKEENKQVAEEEKVAAKKKDAKDKKAALKSEVSEEINEDETIAQATATPAKAKKTVPVKAVKAAKPAVTAKKSAATAAKPAAPLPKKTEAKAVKAKEKKEVKPAKKEPSPSKQKSADKKTPVAEKNVPKKKSVPEPVVKEPQVKGGVDASAETVEQVSLPETAKTIDPETAYVKGVAEYLKNNIFYPWAAKQAELQGTVILDLHLLNTGELIDARVSGSSGYSVLDENALRIARQITPYPSFPRGINEQDLWIQIPIVYNLKE